MQGAAERDERNDVQGGSRGGDGISRAFCPAMQATTGGLAACRWRSQQQGSGGTLRAIASAT